MFQHFGVHTVCGCANTWRFRGFSVKTFSNCACWLLSSMRHTADRGWRRPHLTTLQLCGMFALDTCWLSVREQIWREIVVCVDEKVGHQFLQRWDLFLVGGVLGCCWISCKSILLALFFRFSCVFHYRDRSGDPSFWSTWLVCLLSDSIGVVESRSHWESWEIL